MLAMNRLTGHKYPNAGIFSIRRKGFLEEMIANVTKTDAPPLVVVHIGGNHYNAIAFPGAGDKQAHSTGLPAMQAAQVQQGLYKFFGKAPPATVEPDTNETMRVDRLLDQQLRRI